LPKNYELSEEAQSDLFEIWQRIAMDSLDLANRIEDEFYELFDSLARMPGRGHLRHDLTSRQVFFFPIYSFLIAYQPSDTGIRILAVVRGQRDVKKLLKQR
jgi:plasmid stabilization system protein ParE